MAAQTRRKTSKKTIVMRIVSLSLAGLMLLSVVAAAIWRW